MTSNSVKKNDDQPFTTQRRRVAVQVGSLVEVRGAVFRISQMLDYRTAIGVNLDTNKSEPLRLIEMKAVPEATSYQPYEGDLAEIGDKDWQEAERRYAAIKPLLEDGSSGRVGVEERASELNVDPATLYRWLGRYRGTGAVSSLVSRSRGWQRGKSRISVHTEAVITDVINEYYLSLQRPSAQKAVVEVQRRCQLLGVDAPSPGTIRTRISRISEKESLRGRGFKEKATKKFVATPGTFPNADYPLAVIQIDHTPVDIILVDDENRKPIGRPWLTLAIDVYSRMVTGFYLSLDPPSATSVGLCVSHSILDKDAWLQLSGVEADWPVWGYPQKIHVDNGADFRSDAFKRSCLTHGIHIEFRPVKRAHYGGHIERLLGTFMKETHELPGTTFSSVNEKADYDSEKYASMTRAELEAWLVEQICNIYHRSKHSGLGVTPIRQWEKGVLGVDGELGVGMQALPQDPHTVYLDFLPSFEHTIQSFGVTKDGIAYYADALQPWINVTEPDNPKKKRKFVFRRDPRDISAIWFYDPTLKEYFKIPYANQALPAVSLWEYQGARKKAREEGNSSVDETQVFAAITRQRERVDDSIAKTKKTRRREQRSRDHKKKDRVPVPKNDKKAADKGEIKSHGFSDAYYIESTDELA